MMKRILPVLVTATLAFAITLAIGYVIDNKLPGFEKSYTFFVYPQESLDSVADSIKANAGVKRPASLERALEKENVSVALKPGKYTISPSNPSIYVARMLSRGWQTPVSVTLSGSLRTKGKIARQLGNQLLIDSATVYNALNDNDFLSQYGFDSQSAFSLFLPDTYEMYWTVSLEDLFGRFKKEYDAFWTDERLAKAAEIGLTPKEVSVLASIVTAETLRKSEYARIAGVYMNRLSIGMCLQADPTVSFCYDYKLERVLTKHLSVDSPYNTYMHPGLPPGPICASSKECLDAVLNYERHDYYYFCASAAFDGTHKFAENLSQHLRNAGEFQSELSRRQKRK